MLKENWRLIARLERIGDFIIVVLAFFLAYYGRSSLVFWNHFFDFKLPFTGVRLAPVSDYFSVLIVSIVSYGVFLNMFDAYSSMRLSSPWRLLRISVVCSILVFFVLATVLFLLKIDLSRSFIVLFCTLVALSLTAERYIVLAFLRIWRRQGRNFRSIIICGIGDQSLELSLQIARRPELGIRVRGFADLNESGDRSDIHRAFRLRMKEVGRRAGRIIQGYANVEVALRTYAIDEVIFTDVVSVLPAVETLVFVCAEQGIRTTLAADLFSMGIVSSGLSYFGDIPLIHFQTPPGDRWQLSAKRLLDLVSSAILLVIFSPLLVAIAIAIALTSSGGVFFRQKRVGLHGRLFTLYKFRSMRRDAEHELASLRSQNEMAGPTFKLTNDPRVTRIGKFLRRFSLDELPQLWNVLVGDMSLVGPRPPIPGEVSLYERRDRRRLSMRPGMTCTWQVSGRSEIKNFNDWVKLDLEYIDNWSLTLDFILLFKTIPAVVMARGAR